ncbi:FecR family protein [Propionivibrio dicarboxylicus]|uniref:FecR family protein n=1 Tax=Propionivibrio dicarboxylicus TaxID=83767 RepID=A0A1G8IC10_9RHOO|nr:FecR domain-containing protein [Propionivibrio dicarboxylicus]SDI16426.1 FecR family protein [Propionivibrio dicarboxylicus]
MSLNGGREISLLVRMLRRGFVVCCAALAFAGASHADPIATVEVADGTVFVRQADGKRRILSNGSKVEVGDTLTTEKDSYARLRFTDGSELAVRPSSSLRVNDYHYQEWQPNNDSFSMRLIKGGLRTVTGLIGKRGNQDAYKVEGATATIGIRGTDFVARVCGLECASATPPRKAADGEDEMPNPIAARLFSAEGPVLVTPLGGTAKPLAQGDPVYVGDTVEAAASGHATLVFSDESRVVVNGGSIYKIVAYRYAPANKERNQMFTELIKGGLRVVTGLIGKAQPSAVRYDTVTATIGIRGTNFDMVCTPSGAQGGASGLDVPQMGVSCRQGVYASTREGTIEVASGESRMLVPSGQVGYIDGPGARPVLLPNVPHFLQNLPAPKPEQFKVNHQELFGKDASQMKEAGLYVSVRDGRVALTQRSGEAVELKAGETGFAGIEGRGLMRIAIPPPFINQDAYLRSMNVDPATCR